MVTKINFANLELSELNSECITLITIFARELEKHNGIVLQLTDKGVLRDVIRHSHNTSSTKIKVVYERLKIAIKAFINSDQFSLSDHEKLLISANAKSGRELERLARKDTGVKRRRL